MRIDNAGNVGIGTTAPTAKIEIVQTAATRGFQVIRNVDQANTEALAYFTDEHPSSTQATVRIRNDGTGDALQVMDGSSSALIVDGSGSVGIGIPAPAEALEVAGNIKCNAANGKGFVLNSTTTTGIFRQNGNDLGFTVGGSERMRIASDGQSTFTRTTRGSNIKLELADDGALTGPLLTFYRNSASPADDDNLGKINFSGNNDAAAEVSFAYIECEAKDVSDGAQDGDLVFGTVANGSGAERMRIDSAGNVGIGTASPASGYKLDVNGKAVVRDDLDLYNDYCIQYWKKANGTDTLGWILNRDDNSCQHMWASGQDLLFGTTTTGGSTTEKMRIGSSGQVSHPVTTITPSASATITYTVDMDASNIQNLVCHTDNADITINVSNMAAGKTVKLHVDFSSVSSFSSLTVNWNNNQVYEPDTAMAMVDAIGDDMINAMYTNFMVDLTAYGTNASDVYGNASVFA